MTPLRLSVSVGLVVALLRIVGCVLGTHDEGHAHWAYEGTAEPSAWGSLSPEYRRCTSGDAQSPVDLDVEHVESAALPAFVVHYGTTRTTEENNGHTIQDWVQPGDYVRLNGTRFELEQFHFHHPSEHTLNGVRFPLEVHLVHRSSSGALLALGVLVAEGQEHSLLRVLFDDLPEGHEQRKFTIDPAALLPANNHYILYEGSLTTPPCTEGVTWIVLTEPLSASPEQIHRFAALFPHNNRPLMPLNGRPLRAIDGP
jgi:carbonic anhydrase